MPSKGRNNNICYEKVIHRFVHRLWIQKLGNYVRARGPAANVLTELVTVAEDRPQQRL
jgi:hypothetical protein